MPSDYQPARSIAKVIAFVDQCAGIGAPVMGLLGLMNAFVLNNNAVSQSSALEVMGLIFAEVPTSHLRDELADILSHATTMMENGHWLLTYSRLAERFSSPLAADADDLASLSKIFEDLGLAPLPGQSSPDRSRRSGKTNSTLSSRDSAAAESFIANIMDDENGTNARFNEMVPPADMGENVQSVVGTSEASTVLSELLANSSAEARNADGGRIVEVRGVDASDERDVESSEAKDDQDASS